MKRLMTVAMRRPAAISGCIMVVLALAALLALPVDSEAVGCGAGWLYYSDASHTDLIGERYHYPEECGCDFVGWGQTSAYRDFASPSCF